MCHLEYQQPAYKKEKTLLSVGHNNLPRFARTHSEFADPLQFVSIMSSPLAASQPKAVDVLGYHAFVVIKGERFWWSIDKHSRCVTLQCSSNYDDVAKYLKGVPRNTVNIACKVPAKSGSMIDVIDFLHLKRLLAYYDLFFFNCKKVAEKIYNHFRAPDYPEQFLF